MAKKDTVLERIMIAMINTIDHHIHPKRVQSVLLVITSLLTIILLLMASLSIGILGFMFLEGFGFIDAMYMTVITLSTVGFGEVHQLSATGKIFASLLIITNIGIFAYAVGRLGSMVVEGQLVSVIRNLMIGRKIDRMKDHVIVCGYGRYGQNVFEHLINQGCTVVLVEQDPEVVKKIRRNKNAIALDGDATDEQVLLEAGLDHARAIITTLPEDADNVYVILSARQLNPDIKIISRAQVGSSKKKMTHAGADHVLIPENIGGFYMSSLVTKPDIIGFFDEISSMGESSFKMVEIILDPLPDHLRSKKLGDLQIEEKTGVRIIGVKTPDDKSKVNPSSDLPLLEGMAIIVLGDPEQIHTFHEHTKEFEYIE